MLVLQAGLVEILYDALGILELHLKVIFPIKLMCVPSLAILEPI